MRLERRTFLVGAAAAIASPMVTRAATRPLRIGYQKYGTLLLVKASGRLEQKLKPLGRSVEWKQFIAGPALMEAMGAGAIDVGSAGETPPVFAQAANVPFVYMGAEPPSPRGEAILVRADSPIRTLADLKGKKVAFNKGSNVHYLFLEALQKGGLGADQVKPIYLSPADGRAAFERGSVDAWVIWDPFLAAAQAAGNTRVLVDGDGLAANHQFYLRLRSYDDKAALTALREAITETDREIASNPDAAAQTLAPAVGLPAPIVAIALKRQGAGFLDMSPALVADQQKIADLFFKLGLIPKAVRIAAALA